MKSLAIISEYNPFHNGHRYQLEKARELTGADYCIALMGGNFLQRGEPAYWDKYTRGCMAVSGGVDLVLELPFCYAVGSAKDFAAGAVHILNSLNSIDYLCFGAETDDISLFERISDIVINEPPSYTSTLRSSLRQGYSYAKSRSLAISDTMGDTDVQELLNQPNNILAIEYMCALKQSSSSIKPVIIKRTQAGYNDNNIYNSISSASAIRAAIMTPDADISDIADDVPETTLSLISEAFGKTSPIYPEDMSPYLISALMSKSSSLPYGDFTDICDINEDISNKLNKLRYPTDYATVMKSLCSRQYTGTRISRLLLHLILNYTESDRSLYVKNGYAYYANILSMKKEKSACLRELKQASRIPLITKKADFDKYLDDYKSELDTDIAKKMWQLDLNATRLYNQLVYDRYRVSLKDDFNRILPVI